MASNYHENWKDMTPAERMVQQKTGFNWGWLNKFSRESINDAMVDMANEILRMKAKLKKAGVYSREDLKKLRAKQDKWETMPTRTLQQAVKAERARLLSCWGKGNDARIAESISSDKNVAVIDFNPSIPPTSQQSVLAYNWKTDTLWHYSDAGDRFTVEMRWVINTTNASRFHPIFKHYKMREEALALVVEKVRKAYRVGAGR